MRRPRRASCYVGKRGGCKSTPQAFIEKLMVMAVHEGENVVRLKGGDPFIFGRGGEEVEHLRAAGVPVTVINGITAGLAALTSLGAPLTHREHAHGVVFVTGHAKPGDAGTDWRQLAATARDAKLTLVIYMGVSGAATSSTNCSPACLRRTPVAIVQHASLPQQRHAVDHAGRAARDARSARACQPVGDRGGRRGAGDCGSCAAGGRGHGLASAGSSAPDRPGAGARTSAAGQRAP